jgi:hypothetical protein
MVVWPVVDPSADYARAAGGFPTRSRKKQEDGKAPGAWIDQAEASAFQEIRTELENNPEAGSDNISATFITRG